MRELSMHKCNKITETSPLKVQLFSEKEISPSLSSTRHHICYNHVHEVDSPTYCFYRIIWKLKLFKHSTVYIYRQFWQRP